MQTPKTASVQIVENDLVFECRVPATALPELLETLTRLRQIAAPEAAAPLTKPEPSIQATNIGLKEYVALYKPKRNPDRIALIGWYLQEKESKDHFSKQDVLRGYEHANLTKPKNLNRDWVWAQKLGFIEANSSSPDTFYITSQVRQRFQG